MFIDNMVDKIFSKLHKDFDALSMAKFNNEYAISKERTNGIEPQQSSESLPKN